MRVYASLEAWKEDREAAVQATVATIGNFDGVHRGHRALLAAAREDARARGAWSVAVSFEPHPGRILSPQSAPPLITPLPAKVSQISASGVHALLLLPFTRDLSLLSPREFVERILVRGLRVVGVHEGENFRFGHRHQGSLGELRQLGREFGFAVTVHADVRVRGELASSSRVRAWVAAGAMGRARALLGRPFAVSGVIAPGRGVGRQRTVPTLNLQHYEELLPGAGVYLTSVRLAEGTFAALTNVGVRPTFGPGGPLSVETYLLRPPPQGLAAGLGDPMEIQFLCRLRDERRFDSPEALRGQIQTDIAFAQQYFRRLASINKEELL